MKTPIAIIKDYDFLIEGEKSLQAIDDEYKPKYEALMGQVKEIKRLAHDRAEESWTKVKAALHERGLITTTDVTVSMNEGVLYHHIGADLEAKSIGPLSSEALASLLKRLVEDGKVR